MSLKVIIEVDKVLAAKTAIEALFTIVKIESYSKCPVIGDAYNKI